MNLIIALCLILLSEVSKDVLGFSLRRNGIFRIIALKFLKLINFIGDSTNVLINRPRFNTSSLPDFDHDRVKRYIGLSKRYKVRHYFPKNTFQS